jgi:hypothetical protein
MTGISAVPPGPTMLPTSENKMRAPTNGADFRSHLQAQSRSHVQQPDTTSAHVLSDSTTTLSLRPEMEAMLQMLAWRKRTVSAPSRPGRSVPGTRASGLDIADFNFPVRGVLASSVVTQQSCLNEAGRPLYLKSFDDRTECGEESELSSDIIFGGGLNASSGYRLRLFERHYDRPIFGFCAVASLLQPRAIFSTSQIQRKGNGRLSIVLSSRARISRGNAATAISIGL